MILNKNLFFKVFTSIIKFALKIDYLGSFVVWKLFFKRVSGKLLQIFAGLRHLQVPWKCAFLNALVNPPQICLSEAVRENG